LVYLTILALLQLGAIQISNSWRWDPKSPICALRQQLSAGGYIDIKRTPANDETELTISLSSDAKASEGRLHDGSITLFPGDQFPGDMRVGPGREGKRELAVIVSDPSFFEQLSGATAVAVSHPKIVSPRVTITDAAAAASALRSCEDRLMGAWGIDVQAWRGLKSRPRSIGQVRDRFSALDYPPAALAHHIETDAIMRLDVGVDGRVSRCKMLNPGKDVGFEGASCRVLKGAKFQPARDSSGASVPAPIVYDVVFRLAD
jgi:TonB family protein